MPTCAAMAEVRLQHVVKVCGGSCGKHPWEVKIARSLAGIDFVRLDKNDSGFCRFVDGSGRCGLRDYVYDPRRLRNEACITAAQEDEPSLDGTAARCNAFATPGKKSRKERAAELACMRSSAARKELELVDMYLPQVELNGNTYGPMRVKTPFTVDARAHVQVPLEPAVLQYFRAAILSGGKACEPQTRQKCNVDAPKGASWVQRRSAFVARRVTTVGGQPKTKYRVVRVNDSESNTHDCMDRARHTITSWLERSSADASDCERADDAASQRSPSVGWETCDSQSEHGDTDSAAVGASDVHA